MATATPNRRVWKRKPRDSGNKNAARRVRVAGKIPAVVYGAGKDAVSVSVDPRQVTRILHSKTGHNTIFDLALDGEQHQGHDRRLAVRADQGRAAAHRPEAHRHGQDADRQRADHAQGRSCRREAAGRHSGADSARSRNRVLAGRHSQRRSKPMSVNWSSAK